MSRDKIADKISDKISLHDFRDVPISLFGLGKSGLSCAQALLRGGARISAWDDDPVARARAHKLAIPLSDLRQEEAMRKSQFLLLAPGVSHQHPVVDNARLWGKQVIGDVELLWREYPAARWLAITGTNGKSTTTALLGHIYAKLKRGAQVGGNLGLPVFDFKHTEKRGAGAEIILELSSFQLELIDKAHFDVALILNIAPDHLDRYGSMEAYLSAKMRIARNSKDGDILICGIDDELSQRLFLSLSKAGLRVHPISAQNEAPSGVWVADDKLYDDMDGERKVYRIPECPSLRGLHNAQNIAAAFALARSDALLEPQKIIESMPSFAGLAHRMADLGARDGLRFINDSKATNPHSSAHALVAYADSDVYWLAGGRAKGDSDSVGGAWLQDIYELLLANPFVRAGFFFGETRDALHRRFADLFPCSVFASLAEAFSVAVSSARSAETHSSKKDFRATDALSKVVLFSPACASFDQFKDYVQRGEHFSRLVAELG